MLKTEKDIRRFTRVVTDGPVQFYDGNGALSRATLSDVSYGGLRMTLGRYIKPQTLVQVPVSLGEKQLSFPARVAWCTPDGDNRYFQVGLKADHGGKYTMAILSSWVLEAVQATAKPCGCNTYAPECLEASIG